MARISKNQLVKLQKKYKTDESIGDLFGISRQAVHQLRIKYELTPVDGKNMERDAQVVQLYNDGIAGTRLARRFNLSVSQVYRIINKSIPIGGRNKRS